MAQRDVIVVGASAGGIEALRTLVGGLSADLPASIFVVLHLAAGYPSYLAYILGLSGPLPACEAKDGDSIQPGRILTAPPDHHLLLERGRVTVARGPKENRFRPSVDVLFRSAAHAYGTRVIGIMLSGALDDGVSGLWTIKHFGGIAVVQHPLDAQTPSMPLNALSRVEVDHILPASEMPSLITRLLSEPLTEEPAVSDHEKERLDLEVGVARNEYAFDGIRRLGDASPFSCPECRGVLLKIKEGPLVRFRCHTGHAYTPEALLAAVEQSIEELMAQAMRGLQENVMLLEQMGKQLAKDGRAEEGRAFLERAGKARVQAKAVHGLLEHRNGSG